MDKTHKEKLDYLKLLIGELSYFNSAKSDFKRKFEKVTGKVFHRNLATRILRGEFTFERGLNEYLDFAIEIATTVLERHKDKISSEINLLPSLNYCSKIPLGFLSKSKFI